MYVAFWTVLLGINGWYVGKHTALGETETAVIAGIMGFICLVAALFNGYDLYMDWQDERYERKYLASLEDFPAIEDE